MSVTCKVSIMIRRRYQLQSKRVDSSYKIHICSGFVYVLALLESERKEEWEKKEKKEEEEERELNKKQVTNWKKQHTQKNLLLSIQNHSLWSDITV